MSKRNTLTRRLVAFHEAGHGVASELLGHRVTSVSIDGGPAMHGLCLLGSAKRPPADDDIINAAGDVAAVLYRPDGMQRLDHFIARKQAEKLEEMRLAYEALELDFVPERDMPTNDASKIANGLDQRAQAQAFRESYLAATDLLMPAWPKVRALASLLLAIETVDGARVREIIQTKDFALALACAF